MQPPTHISHISSAHVWLAAAVLDNTAIEHLHHHRNFYWIRPALDTQQVLEIRLTTHSFVYSTNIYGALATFWVPILQEFAGRTYV